MGGIYWNALIVSNAYYVIIVNLLQSNALLHFKFRLAEVGKLSVPKNEEKYETGQFFLHRVFGYRGVILFSWRAKIYDRNAYVSSTNSNSDHAAIDEKGESNASETDPLTRSPLDSADIRNDPNTVEIPPPLATDTDDDASVTRRVGNKEITVNVQNYYQVLIDSRDCPHVVSRSFTAWHIPNR